ncbi:MULTISPECIES: transglutaminase domain-containing protein [Eubacterium]|uniref:Transglutaminase-like superfamily protein n=1 Tax=Eubacterium ruminantium TaxID=42322 RepID=A0A1T4PB59_9FIRM|nr:MULTISPECIES: transglutaminase domain-containing protein [Eubacterium]MCR5368797.1 hypothetical protein [Eubacterium sp.]SCW58401.1 Transglutaminase-like superfamily protein [Eubacterium ruminantium]SDM99071.1 Transglutaminase-like superfamily protein [Eubacterium ruminantium]SJZ88764.1 Transglutaminase-like superfamily protein [Eubacterium ruminantium]
MIKKLFKGIIYIILLALIGYCSIKIGKLIKYKHDESKLQTAENIEEAANIINTSLEKKKADSVSMFIKNIDESKLGEINQYLPSISGSVDSYEIYKSSGKTKVKFVIRQNASTYVYNLLTSSTPIPANNPDADKLYSRVLEIVNKYTYKNMPDQQKVLALHDYLVDTCEYSTGNPNNDNEFRAYGALIDGEAVCSGYAEALTLLLAGAGIKSDIIIGSAGNEPHAWNLVEIDGNWYHIDSTWDDPKGMNVVSHAYYNLTDDEISFDHVWQKGGSKKASSDDLNYFKSSGTIYYTESDFSTTVNILLQSTPKNYLEVAVKDVDIKGCLNELMSASGRGNLTYTHIDRLDSTILIIFK